MTALRACSRAGKVIRDGVCAAPDAFLRCTHCPLGRTPWQTSAPRPGRSSRPWARLRAQVLERDGHRCTAVIDGARCTATSAVVTLEVHHLDGHADAPWIVPPDRLVTVCPRHHRLLTRAKAAQTRNA